MNIYDALRSRPIRRTPDKLLGGVCAGLAHRWGISAALVRILAIALLPFGGISLLLYGLGWLLLPEYGTEKIVAENALRDPDASFVAAVFFTLSGIFAIFPFAGFWFGSFGLHDNWVLWLNLIVLITIAWLLYQRRKNRTQPSGIQNSSSTPQTTEMNNEMNAHDPLSQPQPYTPTPPRTPALSRRTILLVIAVAIAGAAVSIIATPGKIASWLMAPSVALAILALAILLAGIRGMRATWLTALAWVVALPTTFVLVVSLFLPRSLIVTEDLQVANIGGSTGSPTLIYTQDFREIDDASKIGGDIPDRIDSFILAGGAIYVAEDQPVIFHITRSTESHGLSDVNVSGIQQWQIVHNGDTSLLPLAEEDPDDDTLGVDHAHQRVSLRPGDTLQLYSPQARENPDTARVIDIDYSYGVFDFIGDAPEGIDAQAWLMNSESIS